MGEGGDYHDVNDVPVWIYDKGVSDCFGYWFNADTVPILTIVRDAHTSGTPVKFRVDTHLNQAWRGSSSKFCKIVQIIS